jgi:hypothetical protein
LSAVVHSRHQVIVKVEHHQASYCT